MAFFGPVSAVAEDRCVELSSVETELRRLWQGANDPAAKRDAPVTRVSTLNLVAVASNARAAARISEAGAAITARCPCRVIVATVDPDAPDSLEASISAYCHSGGTGAKPICCERISLYASGESAPHLAWAITPLLAPDVRVFVWISGDVDPGSDLFRRLSDLADRLIVDFQSSEHPQRLVAALAARPPHARPAVTDLGWRRTAFWRELVASIFDPPALRTHLPLLSLARVEYAPANSGWQEAQPALMASWFCERLGWKPRGKIHADGSGLVLDVDAPSGPGAVMLSPAAPPGTPPGEISAIAFPTCDHCPVSFAARRVPAGELVELEVERPGVDPLTWRRPLDVRDTAWLLGQELERPHGSLAFERALKVLAAIL